MARAVAKGDTSSVRRLRSEIDELSGSAGRDELSALLDALALEAADSSYAREELVRTVDHLDLARPGIRRILADPHDVDDAAQATLLQVNRNVYQYEGDARFTTWLYQVAHNEALQLLRSKTRKEARDERGSPVKPGEFMVSSLIADQEMVRAIIASLPEQQREVLVLREYDQLDYDEIAERLGVPVGTVRSRLARAREEFNTRLREHVAERLAD